MDVAAEVLRETYEGRNHHHHRIKTDIFFFVTLAHVQLSDMYNPWDK